MKEDELNKNLDKAMEEAYKRGFINGLTEYAWWKDGVQYVGTCGKTLAHAIAGIQ